VRVMQQFPQQTRRLRPRESQLAVFSRNRRMRYFCKPKTHTTRPRMAHVTWPERGEEVSEPSRMCSECDAPPATASRATTPQSVPAQRHKTYPVTWVVTAAIIPLLCWDAWQTYKEARLPKTSVDVKLGSVPRDWAYMPRLDEQLPTPVAQEHGRMPDSAALRSDPSLAQQIR
jgi:hypothetical protein